LDDLVSPRRRADRSDLHLLSLLMYFCGQQQRRKEMAEKNLSSEIGKEKNLRFWYAAQGCQMVHIFSNLSSQFG
jgi:hypothetical protein